MTDSTAPVPLESGLQTSLEEAAALQRLLVSSLAQTASELADAEQGLYEAMASEAIAQTGDMLVEKVTSLRLQEQRLRDLLLLTSANGSPAG